MRKNLNPKSSHKWKPIMSVELQDFHNLKKKKKPFKKYPQKECK